MIVTVFFVRYEPHRYPYPDNSDSSIHVCNVKLVSQDDGYEKTEITSYCHSSSPRSYASEPMFVSILCCCS